MEFFQEIPLSALQAEAVARGLYRLAKVDGLHEREAALVASFFGEVGIGPHAQALAELERRGAISTDELVAALPAPEQRKLFIKTAFLLALADGTISPQEEALLGQYAQALGLDQATVDTLCTAAKEFLLAQLAQVRNVEAVRSVAAKLAL